MTQVGQLDSFLKDIKRLKKKYHTINDDLSVFVKALLVNLPGGLPDTHRIPIGQEFKNDPVFKVKSFRSRCLGGGSRSGIRLIYAYDEQTDLVTLIEIYHKNEKENHDKERLRIFLKSTSTKM